MLHKLTTALLAAGLLAGGSAGAVTVASPEGAGRAITVAQDGNVSVTFAGLGGAYASSLYLVGEAEDMFVFDAKTTKRGTTFDLGDFTAGTELVFRLAIMNRGGYDVYSGDGNRNYAGFANARADSLAGYVTLVSFEDLLGGGDKDFNDVTFLVSNSATGAIPNPVPGAAIAMLTGLAGLAGARARRRTA